LIEVDAVAVDGSARSIIEQLIVEIDRFADGVSQHDDITLLVLKPTDEIGT
jgi:serine phosphatase RsbU (regulator of sigma subunit)